MKRLAIILTHPIQYHSPLFELLTQRKKIKCKVFYTWGPEVLKQKYDPGFKRVVSWDIPLLNGYEYQFVENVATVKTSASYKGIVNPTLNNEVNIFLPDAILVFGWNFNSHLKLMRYFKGKVPILFRGDSTLLDERGMSRLYIWLRRFFLKWVYTKVDKALYVGRANKEYFIKHGLKENQLIFAPHAIDNDRFSKSKYSVDAAAKMKVELSIEPHGIVLLFAGKLEPKKDPETLISAFNQLEESSCYLVIVGNGELEPHLKRKYSDVRNIIWLDFQNQSMMPTIYQMADIFVLPSTGPGETWGLSVNEAMASGLAVVVSNKVGCFYDLVKHDQNGYVFEAGDQIQLVNCLRAIVNDKKKLGEMKKRSVEIIENWKIDIIAKNIENCL